jgi:hypothetical protein
MRLILAATILSYDDLSPQFECGNYILEEETAPNGGSRHGLEIG